MKRLLLPTLLLLGSSLWAQDVARLEVSALNLAYRPLAANVAATADEEYLELPFVESFIQGRAQHTWKTTRNNMSRWMPLAENKYIQDDDGGMLSYTPFEVGDESRYASPAITLKNSSNPVLTFYSFYGYITDDEFTILVSRSGGEYEVVKTIDVSSEENLATWIKNEISLKDYINEEYIQFAFNAKSTAGVQTVIYVDNILIEDVLDYKLEPSFTYMPKRMRVGNAYNFDVNVENRGINDVGSYTIALYADGKLIDSKTGVGLSKGYDKTFAFSVTPDNSFAENTVIEARTSFTQDGEEIINAATDTLSVSASRLPAPQDAQSDGSKLTWKRPAAPDEEGSTVTDGFETYEAFTIEDFGDYTLYDLDKSITFGIGADDEEYDFPNMGEAMAYIVFNPGKAGLDITSENATWKAYNGDQLLVSFCAQSCPNDNWLISPEIDARSAQTISFFARSATANYALEKFEVLYSETDTKTTSFAAVKKDGFSGNATTTWTEYSFALPIGTRYFAIHCITDDGYGMLIDDLTYVPDSVAPVKGSLIGYNIYCNDTKLNAEPVAEESYDISGAQGEEKVYKVTAVYDSGESSYCIVVDGGGSGIEEIIETVKTGDIYDLSGRKITKPAQGMYVQDGRKMMVK